MALDFPANPNDNQTFDNYIYDATKGVWRIIPNVPSVNSRYQISETPPANPFEGQIWFNSTDAVPYMWYVDVDGGQWIEVGGLNGSAEPYIVSDTPPTSEAVNGTQWFDTVTGNVFIYYVDSNSSQWVQISGNIANEPLANLSDVSIDGLAVGDTLIYNGSNWINQKQYLETSDIGTGPSEIPLNQFLGQAAYMDLEDIIAIIADRYNL